jgi:DNA-binding XRE family transcriptional regulator
MAFGVMKAHEEVGKRTLAQFHYLNTEPLISFEGHIVVVFFGAYGKFVPSLPLAFKIARLFDLHIEDIFDHA